MTFTDLNTVDTCACMKLSLSLIYIYVLCPGTEVASLCRCAMERWISRRVTDGRPSSFERSAIVNSLIQKSCVSACLKDVLAASTADVYLTSQRQLLG